MPKPRKNGEDNRRLSAARHREIGPVLCSDQMQGCLELMLLQRPRYVRIEKRSKLLSTFIIDHTVLQLSASFNRSLKCRSRFLLCSNEILDASLNVNT